MLHLEKMYDKISPHHANPVGFVEKIKGGVRV
jgi:hypothetical protein